MAGLKELRTRIESIKSTEKITSAMKMVAAARLRRAQGLIDKCRSYNNNILTSANRVLYELRQEEEKKNIRFVYPELMRGSGKSENYMLLVFTSDRGLCGSYNSNVAREASKRIDELKAAGKNVKILCVGKKGRDILKRKYADLIVDTIEGMARKGARYDEAVELGQKILDMYAQGAFDVCEIVVSRFRSAINRTIVVEQVFPVQIAENENICRQQTPNICNGAFYDYEPGLLKILDGLLPLVFRSSLFQAVVHSQASEQGARMTSMDNATRNAKDMISGLTLRYNRIRQTAITTELTEIIAGAEAL